MWFKEVADPGDPDIDRFAALLAATFADENIQLGGDRMRQFLAASPGPAHSVHLVLAKAGHAVVGGTLFSSVAETGAGFSEYMLLARSARGLGLSRRLFDLRREVLDRQARLWGLGFPGATGLFIEVESPERTPAAYAQAEAITAMDISERRRYFHHMGFRRLDVAYQQPPLAEGKAPVDYLDLLFMPWAPDIAHLDRIDPIYLVQSVAPTFERWAPTVAQGALAALRARCADRPVRLVPLVADPHST